MSLTLFAGEKTTVYGSGGMVVEGGKITSCPKSDRIVCKQVTTKQDTKLVVGSIVQVTTPKSSETYVLQVSAIKGPFDKDGNIQGADIEFTRVKQ